MYDFLENYQNPSTEYKIYFEGKPPVETPPPTTPPKEPPKASSEPELKLCCNDYGRKSIIPIELGDIVVMRYKGKIYLVTTDGKKNVII